MLEGILGVFSRYGRKMLAVYEERLNQVWCANIACQPHAVQILVSCGDHDLGHTQGGGCRIVALNEAVDKFGAADSARPNRLRHSNMRV